MEIVTLAGFGLCFSTGPNQGELGLAFLGLYGGHYVYRSLIYPFLTSTSAAQMPLVVVAMAVVFNVINSTILGGWLYWVGPPFSVGIHTGVGLVLFAVGLFTHIRADAHLRRLRADCGPGYHIPHAGMFRLVSCPNYLGELVQWTGFALMMDAAAGWTFVIWTAANLVPRAIKHHRWYQATFPDYPKDRHALIPGLL